MIPGGIERGQNVLGMGTGGVPMGVAPPSLGLVGVPPPAGTIPPPQQLSQQLGQPIPTSHKDNNHSVGQEVPLLTDYRLAQHNHFLAVKFIFECGAKLEATPMVTATAANLYHRFFQNVIEKDYDNYLIAATTLYLAGKVEGQNIKLRDVINVAYATIHRNSLPLDLDDKYWAFRDAITQAELLLMRVISFQTNITHPHKFLVHYLKTLEEWIGYNPTARLSWSILQDFHHDSSIVSYPPQAVALAAMQLAMTCYGAQVPLCTSEGKNSFGGLVNPDVKFDTLKEIQLKMLNVYDTEDDLLLTVVYKEATNGKQ